MSVAICNMTKVGSFYQLDAFCEPLFPENMNIKAKRGKSFGLSSFLVRLIGLEPTRREAPDPKSGVSTNFTTSAYWEG